MMEDYYMKRQTKIITFILSVFVIGLVIVSQIDDKQVVSVDNKTLNHQVDADMIEYNIQSSELKVPLGMHLVPGNDVKVKVIENNSPIVEEWTVKFDVTTQILSLQPVNNNRDPIKIQTKTPSK